MPALLTGSTMLNLPVELRDGDRLLSPPLLDHK